MIMKKTLACALLLIITACGGRDAADSALSTPAMNRFVSQHNGLEREYFVFLPSTYDGQARHPVALFMHGYGGTATGTEAEVTQGLNRYAEKFGYVMVYPQSTWFMAGTQSAERWEVTSWNHVSDGFDSGPDGPICSVDAETFPCPPECGSCGNCGWSSCYDDIGFLRALVSQIVTDFSIDQREIFVSGFSNGAQMANRIACEASDLFAGVALVGGTLERGFQCTPQRRLPLLQINGGRDTVIPHDGSVSASGYFYADRATVSEHWNEGESCAAERHVWESPTTKNREVQCTVACGATDHPSVNCLWPQGNHRWPGTADFIGSNGYCVSEVQAASMPEQTLCIAADPEADVWGSRLMFEFFEEHRGQ